MNKSVTSVPFGDPVLDELAALEKTRKKRERASELEKCPGCGITAFLIKGHSATLCEECHADIRRLALPGRLWK